MFCVSHIKWKNFLPLSVFALIAFTGCRNIVRPLYEDEPKPHGTENLPALPVLTGTVSIDGIAKLGQTLTVNTVFLNGSGAVTYQWKRNRTPINGASGQSYTLAPADETKTIAVTVCRAGYSGTKTSGPTAAVAGYAVGDTGPAGGLIFYTSGTGGWKYLETAPADFSGTYAWASGSYTSSGITGIDDEIGTGASNTAAILAADPNAPAAKACADYGNNTAFDDWFLPSRNELTTMYTRLVYERAINGFSTNWYWSSSQSSNDKAECQAFSNGWSGRHEKTYKRNVRAVRRF